MSDAPDPLRPDDGNDTPTGSRAALLDAALHLFGRKGYAATSTREIAGRAGANVALIAYHFGGKEGLLAACAEEVARRITLVAGAPADHAGLMPAEAVRRIEGLVRIMVTFLLTRTEAGDLVAFIVQELALRSGASVDTLYSRLIEPKHRELCQLWGLATGQPPEAEATRLAVFAAIGQVVYFRIGLPVVSRRLGWETVGPAEAAAIAETVVANLHASMERSRSR